MNEKAAEAAFVLGEYLLDGLALAGIELVSGWDKKPGPAYECFSYPLGPLFGFYVPFGRRGELIKNGS
jgi:hypothetical protein